MAFRPASRHPVAALALLLAAAYAVTGAILVAERAPIAPPAAGEARGAWHVHTTRSDGRGTLDQVVAAARAAGLQFVVVADHERIAPADQGYRDGVLVIEGLEATTRYGHVVALGLTRPLDAGERAGDPLGRIRALGGEAVLAHPDHPARPFRGFGKDLPWRGLEVFSNDSAWHQALRERALGRLARAALELPWDGGRALLDLAGAPAGALARFDEEWMAARRKGAAGPGARALLCSVDAHGIPSYAAAFRSVSMRVPVRLTGDGEQDARAVQAALLDGAAACVFDARGGLSRAQLQGGAAPALVLESPGEVAGAAARLIRGGAVVADQPLPLRAGENRVALAHLCGGACAPGDYRIEVRRDGAPWVFTNMVGIE